MVDRVVSSRQVHEDSTGDQALLIAIFDVLRQVQYIAGLYTAAVNVYIIFYKLFHRTCSD